MTLSISTHKTLSKKNIGMDRSQFASGMKLSNRSDVDNVSQLENSAPNQLFCPQFNHKEYLYLLPIWWAAFCQKKLKKRTVVQIQLRTICDQLRMDLKKHEFSLHCSARLVLGACLFQKRQMEYLSQDCASFTKRLTHTSNTHALGNTDPALTNFENGLNYIDSQNFVDSENVRFDENATSSNAFNNKNALESKWRFSEASQKYMQASLELEDVPHDIHCDNLEFPVLPGGFEAETVVGARIDTSQAAASPFKAFSRLEEKPDAYRRDSGGITDSLWAQDDDFYGDDGDPFLRRMSEDNNINSLLPDEINFNYNELDHSSENCSSNSSLSFSALLKFQDANTSENVAKLNVHNIKHTRKRRRMFQCDETIEKLTTNAMDLLHYTLQNNSDDLTKQSTIDYAIPRNIIQEKILNQLSDNLSHRHQKFNFYLKENAMLEKSSSESLNESQVYNDHMYHGSDNFETVENYTSEDKVSPNLFDKPFEITGLTPTSSYSLNSNDNLGSQTTNDLYSLRNFHMHFQNLLASDHQRREKLEFKELLQRTNRNVAVKNFHALLKMGNRGMLYLEQPSLDTIIAIPTNKFWSHDYSSSIAANEEISEISEF